MVAGWDGFSFLGLDGLYHNEVLLGLSTMGTGEGRHEASAFSSKA